MPLEIEFKVGTGPPIKVVYDADLRGSDVIIRVLGEECVLLLSVVEAQLLLEALDKVIDYQPEIVPGRERRRHVPA